LNKLLASILILAVAATSAFAQKTEDWRTLLRRELPVMGHRNWLVVADSAYPEQVSPGVITIYTGQDHLTTIKEVLKMVAEQRHVSPDIYLDQELTGLDDNLAPGISAYKNALNKILGGRPVAHRLHEDLIKQLDESGKTFRVIILKTTYTLPYTTVFMWLDCKYWGPAKEAKLRAKMGRG